MTQPPAPTLSPEPYKVQCSRCGYEASLSIKYGALRSLMNSLKCPKCWNAGLNVLSLTEWGWQVLTGDPTMTSVPSSTSTWVSRPSSAWAAPPPTDPPEKNSKATPSPPNSSATSTPSPNSETRSVSYEQKSTLMDAYEQATISLAHLLAVSRRACPSSEQEVISKTWKSLCGLYSSRIQATNSPNATPSPESPTASEPSNGTDLETELTSMQSSLETFTQQSQSLYGLPLDGVLMVTEIVRLLNSLSTVHTAIASCVKSLATARTTTANPSPLPSNPSYQLTLSLVSNSNTSEPSRPTNAGKLMLNIDSASLAILLRLLADNGGSLDGELTLPLSARPLRMTLREA